MVKTYDKIIKEFINSGYRHMTNIPNNTVVVTDNSCSTLAWVEDNVVIEYYLLFPNLETPMHSHPFYNQIIFISGELTAHRRTPATVENPNWKPNAIVTREFTDSDTHYLSNIMPIGYEHGFTVGARGAVIYNIQIWPDSVGTPSSAAIEYVGESMGPIHDKLLESTKTI